MKPSHLFVAAGLALASVSALAGETLFVQVPAGIDPSAPISDAVRSECGVDMLLGNQALSALGRNEANVQAITSSDKAGNNKFVQLTVLSVHATGGGAWSGPKSMSIRVDLKRGDATLKTAVLSRSSSGGAFGGLKGNCAILDRVVTTLGKDVAKWVEKASTSESTDLQTDAQATENKQY